MPSGDARRHSPQWPPGLEPRVRAESTHLRRSARRSGGEGVVGECAGNFYLFNNDTLQAWPSSHLRDQFRIEDDEFIVVVKVRAQGTAPVEQRVRVWRNLSFPAWEVLGDEPSTA
jgi:hypothetical protein